MVTCCSCFAGLLAHIPKVKHTVGVDIHDHYKFVDSVLGEGSFGAVSLATEKKSHVRRAIKQATKINAQGKDHSKLLHRERVIMASVHHPQIVRLFETFEDERFIYFVMEVCDGGELFDFIVERKYLSEKNCAWVLQQLLYAINYLHSPAIKILHRDLKPENLLLSRKVQELGECDIRLADFGFARRIDDGPLKTKCGSPKYVAPEVMMGSYDERCDLWSVGVIMYLLLSGHPPFTGRTPKDVLRAVVKGKPRFPDKYWSRVGPDSRELIETRLLVPRQDRLRACEAVENPWIKWQAPGSKNVHLHDDLVENMKNFQSHGRTKQIALHVIATQLDPADIEDLRATFTALDTNRDGHLSPSEFKEGMTKNPVFKRLSSNFKGLMEGMDTDHSGAIDYTEFIAATMDRRMQVQESVCWRAFRRFDLDGNGRITRQEFKKVLEDEHIHQVKDANSPIFKDMDTLPFSGDSITFGQFMALIRAS